MSKQASHAAHQAARNIEDATDGAPEPAAPTPPEATKKRATSNGVLAGRLFERINAWRADCDAEVNASPQAIKAKWAAKIKAELDRADPFVRELTEKMLKADEPKKAEVK